MENISPSNLKQLLDYAIKNKNNVNNIIIYYKPIAGYLYCMYNEVFNYYGDNVYKIDMSKGSPRAAILQVVKKKLDRVKRKERVAKGLKV